MSWQPTGWVPDNVLNAIPTPGTNQYSVPGVPQNIVDTFTAGGTNGVPPQHIIDYLSSVGTPWDPAKYSWDPNTGNLTDRSSGGSWDMRSVPNNSLGSYVALGSGMNPTAESDTNTPIDPALFGPQFGSAYQFAPGQGPTFFGNPSGSGQVFFSNDPAAIDEYQHDARTRRNQAIAQIATLIGGASAIGGAGAGSSGGTGSAAVSGTNAFGGAVAPAAGGTTGLTAAQLSGAELLPGVAGTNIGAGLGVTGGSAITSGAAGASAAGIGATIMNNLPTIIGAGASLLGGKLASDAAGDAVDAQVAAGDRALDFQRESRDIALGIARPQLQASNVALAQMLAMTGQPIPESLRTALEEAGVTDIGEFDITQDPSYQFRLDESMKALENSAFARGGGMSGGFANQALRYAQNFASTEYANIYGRLATIGGYGPVAANTSSNAALNYGANAGNIATNTGEARASGYVAQSNAWQNALDQIAKLPWDQWFPRRQPAVAGV